MVERAPRRINKEEKDMFLALKPDDITLELLQDLFANTWDPEKHKVIPSRFETYDEIVLKKENILIKKILSQTVDYL